MVGSRLSLPRFDLRMLGECCYLHPGSTGALHAFVMSSTRQVHSCVGSVQFNKSQATGGQCVM